RPARRWIHQNGHNPVEIPPGCRHDRAMIRTSPTTRRRLLSGAAALAALAPARALAHLESAGQRGFVLGSDFGLVSNPPPAEGDRAPYDQSASMQAAVDAAAEAGLPLLLP